MLNSASNANTNSLRTTPWFSRNNRMTTTARTSSSPRSLSTSSPRVPTIAGPEYTSTPPIHRPGVPLPLPPPQPRHRRRARSRTRASRLGAERDVLVDHHGPRHRGSNDTLLDFESEIPPYDAETRYYMDRVRRVERGVVRRELGVVRRLEEGVVAGRPPPRYVEGVRPPSYESLVARVGIREGEGAEVELREWNAGGPRHEDEDEDEDEEEDEDEHGDPEESREGRGDLDMGEDGGDMAANTHTEPEPEPVGGDGNSGESTPRSSETRSDDRNNRDRSGTADTMASLAVLPSSLASDSDSRSFRGARPCHAQNTALTGPGADENGGMNAEFGVDVHIDIEAEAGLSPAQPPRLVAPFAIASASYEPSPSDSASPRPPIPSSVYSRLTHTPSHTPSHHGPSHPSEPPPSYTPSHTSMLDRDRDQNYMDRRNARAAQAERHRAYAQARLHMGMDGDGFVNGQIGQPGWQRLNASQRRRRGWRRVVLRYRAPFAVVLGIIVLIGILVVIFNFAIPKLKEMEEGKTKNNNSSGSGSGKASEHSSRGGHGMYGMHGMSLMAQVADGTFGIEAQGFSRGGWL